MVGNYNKLNELKQLCNRAFEIFSYRHRMLELPNEETTSHNNYSKRPDRDAVRQSKTVIDEVIQRLVDGSENLEVVSLCGLDGMGKTTLAHQVFNDSRIECEFFTRIWIHLPSGFTTKEMLLHILSTFHRRNEYTRESEYSLVEIIAECISKGGKCLIVVDDVCSTDVLDKILRLFPNNNKGHRILLTTSMWNKHIANCFLPESFVFTLRGLNKDGAWELFVDEYRRHNRGDNLIRADMEDIGRQIVKRCEGFPPAIIKVAQELADRESLDEWNVVHQNLMSFLSGTVLQTLGASFHYIPNQLKTYFVYLGLWPEDSVIDVEKLYQLWMFEGLLKPDDIRVHGTLFKAGEFYLTELARIGMIDVEEEELALRIRKISIHRMMRLLCISKCNQIYFSHIIGSRFISYSSSSSSRNKTRYLFVCLERPEDVSSILTKKEHLRILYILDPYKQQGRKPVRLSGKFDIKDLRLLRLLDFDGVDFGLDEPSADGKSNVRRSTDLLEGISELFHLRYLSFNRCLLYHLPLSISKLWNLQVLDLRVDDSITEVTLPNVLWKLRNMKHLYLPRVFRTYKGDKLRLDGLTELEALENFIPRVCSVTDLRSLIKLHNLAVKIDDGNLSDLKFINEHVKQSNNHIRLSIDVRNFDCYVEEKHSVIRELLQHQNVHIFSIEGHIGELPSKHKISPSLTKLVLIGSELEKDPMEKLAKLSNLQVLVLDDNAFEGAAMVSPASGFTELKRLELLNLKYLESWTVENSTMPKLSNIKIENCKKLKIPDGLKFLTALKELEIAQMPKQFVEMLRKTDGTQGEDIPIVKYVEDHVHDN